MTPGALYLKQGFKNKNSSTVNTKSIYNDSKEQSKGVNFRISEKGLMSSMNDSTNNLITRNTQSRSNIRGTPTNKKSKQIGQSPGRLQALKAPKVS